MDTTTPIAVCSRSFSRNPVLREELLRKYSNVRFNDEGLSLDSEALVKYLAGVERAVIALESITDGVLSQLPNLKVIAKYGVGLDSIDLRACSDRGVAVGWTGGVNRRSVTELTISFAIALLRHVVQGNVEVRDGTWRQLIGGEISGRTVGIIGCGHIGQDLTGVLQAFGSRVIFNDVRDLSAFSQKSGAEQMDLDDLLQQADIVTLHLPYTDQTQNMLNADRFARMQSHAILINTCRGGIVDEAALKSNLMDGSLAGAAFDVFASEPPEDTELLMLPNFISTPHLGGSSAEAILAMGRAAIDGLDNNKDGLAYIPDYL